MVELVDNRYSPDENKCYLKLVKLVNLAAGRGVRFSFEEDSNVFKAHAKVRQVLLNDYAEKKLLTAQSRHQQRIQEYKDGSQPMPIYLGEKIFALEDFFSEATLDMDYDLGLIPDNPCHQNPLAEYYKFHEK